MKQKLLKPSVFIRAAALIIQGKPFCGCEALLAAQHANPFNDKTTPYHYYLQRKMRLESGLFMHLWAGPWWNYPDARYFTREQGILGNEARVMALLLCAEILKDENKQIRKHERDNR